MILQGSDNTRFYQPKIDLANSMTTKKRMSSQRPWWRLSVSSTSIKCHQDSCASEARTATGPRSYRTADRLGNRQPHCRPMTLSDCGLKGHYKSNCPELQVQELDVGVQNLDIDMCEEAHSLFSANKGWIMVQEEKKESSGVQGIFLKHHVYIDKCASYLSTLYPNLLENMKKQAQVLGRQSNAGSCRMDTTGEMGSIKQMWLNKGGGATIIPLKVLETIWTVTYDSRHFCRSFVIHLNQGNIIVKNNIRGMSFLSLRKLEAKAVLSFVQTVVLFIQTVRGDM